MRQNTKTSIIIRFFILVALVAAASVISNSIWSGKPEQLPQAKTLVIQDGMTVADFGQKNNMPTPVLKKVFGLADKQDLQKDLNSFNLSRDEIVSRVNKAMALAAEEASKNWIKILIKFGLWFAFLIMVFVLMRKGRVTPQARKWLYLAALVLFGVILGSDPSAMGTVKDALHLYGAQGVVFPPRMIAFTVFLLMVYLANKYICSWGCQLGTLQDLIFRLGRTAKDNKGLIRQYKPPFRLTNCLRAAFLVLFTLAAFLWAVDIIDPIDPFKIYKPAVLGAAGIVFIGLLLLASLFTYRPWCHFLCPFGLVGWLVEKISLFKIKVNYDTCVACEACARACPSTVMEAILKRNRVIPDCFSCATCMNVCPTNSISFSAGRRSRPPEGHFEKKDRAVDSDRANGVPPSTSAGRNSR